MDWEGANTSRKKNLAKNNKTIYLLSKDLKYKLLKIGNESEWLNLEMSKVFI
jgi:hypothetical protein